MNKNVIVDSDSCACVQIQSVIRAVLEEVDDALQLLHSQVYFRLYAVFFVTVLPIFTHFSFGVTSLCRS